MNIKIWAISTVAFMLLFNFLFFFLTGFEHNTSVWASYIFIMFAFVLLLAVPLFTPKSSDELMFSYTTVWITALYLLIELCIGGFFLVTNYDNFNLALAAQLIVAVVFVILLFLTINANNKASAAEAQQKKNTLYIKQMSIELTNIWKGCSDDSLKKKIEHTLDMVKSSQTVSPDCVHELEQTIQLEVEGLQRVVSDGDRESVCAKLDHIEQLLKNRDDKIRMSRYR